MERDASTDQKDRDQQWSEGLGRDVICFMFSTNPGESAEPVHPECVVTPRTRRTLPSQNSTFVMSRRRSCDHGVDWAACFYCPTTWLTFQPQQASVLGHTIKHQKKKRLVTWAWQKKERQQKSSAAATVAPFMLSENTDVKLQPKRRVHSSPKAVLSLIRAASSCRQQSPANFAMADQHTHISDPLLFFPLHSVLHLPSYSHG